MLRDVLVIDLTRHLPGPYATWLLAHHGATVLKVEAPEGDPARFFPPYDDAGVSAVFAQLNRGKRSLGLDLKHPQGVETLHGLLERADVVVEGFRPGVLERLGVDLARHPRLVRCSLSGYGQTGPYRDTPGHDLNYQAYAGALSQAVGEDGHPALPGLQLGDMSAALSAVIGILLALHERARTGVGRTVDASMLEALVSFQTMGLSAHLAGQPWNAGQTLLTGAVPCYRVYATADGRSGALGALEPKFWLRFCAAVGQDDWSARQFDGTLCADVAALFRGEPLAHWRALLEDAGCCWSPVLDYDDLARDPHVQARGLLPPGPPFRFDPPLAPPAAPCPPQAGADSRAILTEHLGLEPAAVDALVAAGAVLE
ncbi:MAG: CoA transferase [Planctomycetes bacterium]|nr:CoA transferase [Planctomycetota bacterium]